MSHSISRRQFLKASGTAVLSTAAAGLLSSCGGSSASNGGSTASGKDSSTYTVLYSRQPATLNYLICSADPDLYHGTQCIDTRQNPRGPCHQLGVGCRQPDLDFCPA